MIGAPSMVTSHMSGRVTFLSMTDPKAIPDGCVVLPRPKNGVREAFLRTAGVRTSPPSEFSWRAAEAAAGGQVAKDGDRGLSF
jgi:hypothetical protein